MLKYGDIRSPVVPQSSAQNKTTRHTAIRVVFSGLPLTQLAGRNHVSHCNYNSSGKHSSTANTWLTWSNQFLHLAAAPPAPLMSLILTTNNLKYLRYYERDLYLI